MTTRTADDGGRPPGRRTIGRSDLIVIVVVAALGVAWGAAWQRSAALVDVASFLPTLLLLAGPGVLLVFLAYRAATGRIWSPAAASVTVAALGGALVGSLVTPGLAPTVAVRGHVVGTLEDVAVDAAGTCAWGPGRTAVIQVTAPLPATPGMAAGYFSASVPSGTLVIELPSGAARVQDIPQPSGLVSMPLRNGTGGVGEGDRASGAVTLDPAQGAAVAGQLAWTCDPAPAP